MELKSPFRYYRIKTEYTQEKADGSLQKTKAEELVLASSYTEAESLVNSLICVYKRDAFGDVDYEIIRTKISDVIYNDILQTEPELIMGLVNCYFTESDETGVGLYSVKCIFLTADEKTGKEKNITETYYLPAESNADATRRLVEYLKTNSGVLCDYVIRDTKFDKAEAIYWPQAEYQNKTAQYHRN